MKKTAVLLALALMAAGCGPSLEYWCHPDKDNQKEFPAANYECEGEAYRRAADLGQKGDDDVIRAEWEKCMRMKGWSPCGPTR